MKKKMIILAAAALAVAGGAGAYFFYFAPGDTEEGAGALESAEPGLVQLDPFLTNISDPSMGRHTRLELKLAVSPRSRAKEVMSDELLTAKLRDQVLTALNAMSYEQLTSPGGKDDFRDQLSEQLGPIIAPGRIDQIFFADFVVQ